MKINLKDMSGHLVRVLHILDCVLSAGLLWFLANWVNVRWSDYYNYLIAGSFLCCFVTYHSFGLYRPWRGHKLSQEFAAILKAWACTVGFVLFVLFVTVASRRYSRHVVMLWFALTPFLVFSVHVILRQILRLFRKRGKNLRKAVIVGAGTLGSELVQHIENIPWAGIRVLGFFDDKIDRDGCGELTKPILGTISQLFDYLKVNRTDYVYVALPMNEEEQILSVVSKGRTLGAELYLVPDLLTYRLLNAEIESLGQVLVVNFNPCCSWKRYFDLVFSAFAILITLPVSALVALLILLEDRGPILYGHKRITATGKEFKCLKFRTMAVDADKKLKNILDKDPKAREEWQKTFKLRNDPRVTRIGRFLRKTSLDELPQFINVLKGEMSVVGARPVVLAELRDYYKKEAGLYCSMKPGITGPWQVGKRSDTEDYKERVELDTWYVLNHSLWLDIKIIFKTVSSMISGKGAY